MSTDANQTVEKFIDRAEKPKEVKPVVLRSHSKCCRKPVIEMKKTDGQGNTHTYEACSQCERDQAMYKFNPGMIQMSDRRYSVDKHGTFRRVR